MCYYIFNRNSYYLYWFMVGAILILDLLIILVPESPKFLYARNKFDDCRKSLYFIARVNKSKNLQKIHQIKFDTEAVLNQEGQLPDF